MKTLKNFYEDLVVIMKKYNDKVFVTLTAKVNHQGEITFTAFVSLGDYPNVIQSGFHDAYSPEELIQKAEGWAKIVTTKLEIKTEDVVL